MTDLLFGLNCEEAFGVIDNEMKNMKEWFGDPKNGQKSVSEISAAELYGALVCHLSGIPAEEFSKSISEFESPMDALVQICVKLGENGVEGITVFEKSK